MSRRAWWAFVCGCILGTILALAIRGAVHAACQSYPVTQYSPTGIVGCEVYGQGTASMWGGPGAARNDCVYPWTNCQTISIRSLQTGLVVIVTPTMFCDCYTGTSNQRIVDLDRSLVLALGLDPDDGLWPVEVQPVDRGTGMPNTAMASILPTWMLIPYVVALAVGGFAWGYWSAKRRRK